MSANDAAFTIGAEAASARTVAVQLGSRATRGATARPIGTSQVVEMYLSSDADGDVVLNPVEEDVVPTAGTDGTLVDEPITGTKASWRMKSEDDGDIDVVLTNASDDAATVYLNVILGNGKVATSAAIAFADDTP